MFLVVLFADASFAHGMSEEEKLAIIEGGNLRYMWLGATHMLSGYDHLAFVFGIIFFLTNFRDIAKYVTAFTVGHSVTLIYATFNAIQVNYFLIDAVIALSVCYIAFTNLDGFRKYLSINPPNMMVMILSLGLIHGLGLSTRLQELPLSEDELLFNIISFNVGIEIGQISALVLMLLIIATFRKSHFFQTFSTITNYLLIIAGSLLFLMQMHGYEHTANAAEFTNSATPQQKAVEIKSTVASQLSEWKDTINLTIPARADKEYKVFVKQGAAFDYVWVTDGEKLYFDFHGEPSGDTTGAFQSFEKNTATHSSGTLVTTFSGTHGWYWKNYTNNPVFITLKLNGEYQRKDNAMVVKESSPVSEKRQPKHDSID
ncbi:MAG: HupE/UreJ family protein [Gammaproteobacteria bacterium]|nr:HupE/UreJ family protein [Gammaproteobacteria bacterium]